MSFAEVVANLADKSLQTSTDDYAVDGLLYCGKCKTRKQHRITLFGVEKEVGIPCKCRKAESDALEARVQGMNEEVIRDRLRQEGLTDEAYLNCTFDRDDLRNPEYTKTCKRYVEEWPEMQRLNAGVLFFGGVGTGKSFLACAIANALIDQMQSVSVTSLPRILSVLQGGFDEERKNLLRRIREYDLLVIDDLGVERDTPYATEQVYSVIDARYLAKKPLIITTNLTAREIQAETNLSRRRIYDRIWEMCPIRLNITGETRRGENAEAVRIEAKRVLEGKHEKNQTSS
ncbi:MAG TPA: ATP-binding protein [Clostridiales bacterium]|nr:ATP-binding protein [Clostridiales bacterium]